MTERQTMQQLADNLYGADPYKKPAIYLREYERLFSPLRDKPVRLLELGVYKGASMQMWDQYFPHAESRIVGLDGAVMPETFPASDRFHFAHGEQADPALLDAALEFAGEQFDIIIDDASHLGCHTGRSFAHLFPKALKPGGVYIIEDICTAFLKNGEYDAAVYAPPLIGVPDMPKIFPSHQHGMVGLVKQLIDHVQAPTAAGDYTNYPIYKMEVFTNFAVLHKAP